MKLGARIVIASYLGKQPKFKGRPDTGFQISNRAQSFMRFYLDQKILEPADLVIAPDVNEFHWADFSAIDELVKAGRFAVEKNTKKIKSVTTFWYRLRKTLSMTI